MSRGSARTSALRDQARARNRSDRGALSPILALAAIVRLWGLGGAAGAVLRFGRVSRRRRVSGQRGRAGDFGVVQPGARPSIPARRARHPGRHRRPPARHRQAWPRRAAGHLDAAARQDRAGRRARFGAGRHRHRRGDVRPGHARLGPARGDPRGRVAGDLGPDLVYSREPLVEADGLFFATARRARLSAVARACAACRRGRAVGRRLQPATTACRICPPSSCIAELARWPGFGASSDAAWSWRGFLAPLAAIEGAYLAGARRRARRRRAHRLARLRPAARRVHAHESARSAALRRVADLLRRPRPDGRAGRPGPAAGGHRGAGLAVAPRAAGRAPTCCWPARCWSRWRCTACTRRAKSACGTSRSPCRG